MVPVQRVSLPGLALEGDAFGQGRGKSKLQGGFLQKTPSLKPQQCPHLQEGAVPEAAPDMQHGHTIKAVEWAAEDHTLGRALGAVLGTRICRTLSQQAHEFAVSLIPFI